MISITPNNLDAVLLSLQNASNLGIIQPVQDPSQGLLVAYKGNGLPISGKWNVKIYRNKKGRISTVTNDSQVLQHLVDSNWSALTPSSKKVLQIDDAGIGFPLGGIMVGVTDGTRVETAVVPTEYFQGTDGASKAYLQVYANLGLSVISRFETSPGTHRIEICTGWINSLLSDRLRAMGYEVHKVEIKGLLQDTLEDLFRDYIRRLIGNDIYYDPKDVKKSSIASLFERACDHGMRHPESAKTCWETFQCLSNKTNNSLQ